MVCKGKPLSGHSWAVRSRIKPLRGSAVKDGFFIKEQFHYDADAGVLICPGGAKLEPKYKSKIRDNDAIGFVNTKACKTCDLRARCTNAAFRKVTRYANEAILDRMAARLAANPEGMDQRRESVGNPPQSKGLRK